MRSIQERHEVLWNSDATRLSDMTLTAREALQTGIRCITLVIIWSLLSISAVARPRCDHYMKAGVSMRSLPLLFGPSAVSIRTDADHELPLRSLQLICRRCSSLD